MISMTLRKTINKIIKENPYATFLVNGDTIRGDILSYKCPNSARFIFVRDGMVVGTAAPDILSKEFIVLRAAVCNNPYYKPYTVEEYETDFASELKKLSAIKHSEIVLVQSDCYVSQIWQLTMQAYIEQNGIASRVKRICFYDNCKADFYVSHIDEISVEGAHAAYCQLVCRHKTTDLSKFLISEEAVNCYLDINSPTGQLREYICNTSSRFENYYSAYGNFLSNYEKWGLDHSEFLWIATQTLSQFPKYAKVIKVWNKMLNEHRR